MTDRLEPEDVVGVLTAVGSVIHELKRVHAEHEGIDHGAAVILGALYRCGPQRPSELARLTSLDMSTVSRYARSLEDAGRVVKVADPADGRAHRLALTDDGIEHMQGLWRIRVERLMGLIGHWSAKDAATLSTLANRLAEDLGRQWTPTMPDPEDVRATHRAAIAETLPKGA